MQSVLPPGTGTSNEGDRRGLCLVFWFQPSEKWVFNIDKKRWQQTTERNEEGGEGREKNSARAVGHYCFVLEPQRWQGASCGTHGGNAFNQREQHIQRPWGAKKRARALVREESSIRWVEGSIYYKQEFSLVREWAYGGNSFSDSVEFCAIHRVLSAGQFPSKPKYFFSFSFLPPPSTFSSTDHWTWTFTVLTRFEPEVKIPSCLESKAFWKGGNKSKPESHFPSEEEKKRSQWELVQVNN